MHTHVYRGGAKGVAVALLMIWPFFLGGGGEGLVYSFMNSKSLQVVNCFLEIF